MFFSQLRNAILGILGERLHYYRRCHYNTHIQVDINKSLKKAEIASFFKGLTHGGSGIFSNQILNRGIVLTAWYK